MRIQKIFASCLFSLIGLLAFAPAVFASTPTLSVSGNGDGDNVTVAVNGDANANVLMGYTKTGVGLQIQSIGTTNSSGYLSATISTSGYGIASGSAVYVYDIVNGQQSSQSSSVLWPYGSSTGTLSTITLSQTGLVLAVGGASTITASGSSSLYLSNNSNPSVVNVSISGNSIAFTGNRYGSAVVTICPQSSSTNCPSVYVTVQNSGAAALTFSQPNPTIAYGQSLSISISGGNTGAYSILNNSNSSYVTASLSGSTVTLNAIQSSGSASITVCSADMSSCGIINVTIGAASTATLYFSQSNPVISTGQSLVITVSGGGTGSYYISSNSNTSILQATINGSYLTLYGILNGTSTVVVCSSLGSCNSLSATVSYISNGGSLTLSQSNVNLLAGQSLSITVSGGSTPYSLSSNSGNIFQATLNGNIINLYGVNSGSSSVSVCSSGGACVTLSVVVNGGTGSTNGPSFSQSSISLTAGQSQSVTLSGNSGYYISGNTNSSVATAMINGSTITVSGLTAGNSNISVCQSGGQCSILYVWVTSGSTVLPSSFLTFSQDSPSLSTGQSLVSSIFGGTSGTYYVAYNSSSSVVQTSISGSSLTISGVANGCSVIVICSSNNICGAISATVGATSSTSTGTTTTGTTTSTTKYTFTEQITSGDSGDEVSALQQRLKDAGYFTGSVTGYYGILTTDAVRSYQKANGINQTGTMGPLTMAALNK